MKNEGFYVFGVFLILLYYCGIKMVFFLGRVNEMEIEVK